MIRFFWVLFCVFLMIAQVSAQARLGTFTARGAASQEMRAEGLVAAHPSLPLNSKVKITNPGNGREIEVTIAGRIDPSANRIVDLSSAALRALGIRAGDTVVLTVDAPPRPVSIIGQDDTIIDLNEPNIVIPNAGEQTTVTEQTVADTRSAISEQTPANNQVTVIVQTPADSQIAVIGQIPVDSQAAVIGQIPVDSQVIANEPIIVDLSSRVVVSDAVEVNKTDTRTENIEHTLLNGTNGIDERIITAKDVLPAAGSAANVDFLAWLMTMSIDAREAREARESREIREAREARESREAREAREIRETREARESREAREAREARESRDVMHLLNLQSQFVPSAETAKPQDGNRLTGSVEVQPQSASQSQPVSSNTQSAANSQSSSASSSLPANSNTQSAANSQSSSASSSLPANSNLLPAANPLPAANQAPARNDGGSQRSSVTERAGGAQVYPPAVQPDKIRILPSLPDRNSGKIYRLQVGAYSDPGMANEVVQLLYSAGFDVQKQMAGSICRVLVAGIVSDNVYPAAVRLGSLGFSQVWVRE